MKKFIIFSVLAALNVAQIGAKDDCFSEKLGYPCCKKTKDIVYSDEDGPWGVEDNSWCGIQREKKKAMNAGGFGNWFGGGGNNNWSFNPFSWFGGNNNNNNAPTAPTAPAAPAAPNNNAAPNNPWGNWGGMNNNANANPWGNWGGMNANNNNNWNNWNPNQNNNNNPPAPANNNPAPANNNPAPANNNPAPVNNNPAPVNNNPAPAAGGGSVPEVTGGKTGTTTGYWDCCVASCSWDGNVEGSKPVKACKKDGVSLITEELWKVKSVCDNEGDGYMCNDNQPIVINDNLALGFAASHEKCCSCQLLQFTSSNVKGKKMIVQVTNTGSDIGSNHFDLQIPGAGVGIFNGCSKQWGAPGDGWGRRYGGVTTKAECSQLPAQLRAGCEWRFGWFASSDNPGVVYERVQCPKQLTDITGCVLPDDAQQKKVV